MQQLVKKISLSICFLLALSFAQNSLAVNKQQSDFLQTYEILHKGGIYDSAHLQNYLLHPYLEYERIKQNLKKSSNQALIDFIHKNRNSWLAEDLTTDLLQRLAKQKKWKALLQLYTKGQGGNKAKCLGLEAGIRMHPSQTLLNEARQLWLSGNRRPKICNPLFSLLKQKSVITDQLAWKRISMAMKKGRSSLALDLAKHINEPSLVSLWVKIRKSPSKHLNNRRLKKNDQRSRQLITYGIKRLARKNTTRARQQWKNFKKTHRFTAKEKADVDSYIASRDAFDHHPQALQEFSTIPANLRTDEANLWMARLALRQGDWRKLRSAVNSMNNDDKQRDRWRYWRAHAGKKLGEKNTHQQLQAISHNASFYGFLAADELNRPYTRLQQAPRNWQQLTTKIAKMKSMQRATELFNIGKPKLAKKEWNWTLKRLNKQDKLIAAAYALQIKQPFLAIITVSKTKDWNQVGLRFPLEYQSLVKQSARKHSLIPAWVYGIMRRESAFDSQIVSSANAKGLMQVLPSTAKQVARKLGIKKHRTSDLLIPEKNANIGAAYLSQMLKRFKGNYVKATASYNAGPHRIPRWTPKRRISAARWIESIPFNETRNYVRAVMSYTTIYDHKLNAKQGSNLRLSKRLQAVGP